MSYRKPRELPEPWASKLREQGLVSPLDDSPSLNALSRETGIHTSSLSRMIHGDTNRPRPDYIEKIAAALDVAPSVIAKWLGDRELMAEPWTPPRYASLMTPPQRRIVEELISQLTAHARKDEK